MPLVPFLLFLSTASASPTGVSVTVGPTPIPLGKSRADNDVTLRNDHLAVSFGVGTPSQWGVPPGGILDGAVVVNGTIGPDHISFIDFLPDGWTVRECRKHSVEVLESGPGRGVVRVTREYDDFVATTTYTLAADSSELAVAAVLRATESAGPLALKAGYSLCSRDGVLFMPGLEKEEQEGPEVNDWAVAYGPDWAVGLYSPGADATVGGSAWRDLYHRTTLGPGQEVEVRARFRFDPSGTAAGILETAVKEEGGSRGRVHGQVTLSGKGSLERPVIVVSASGKLVTWAVGAAGRYDVALPPGRYELRATAADHRPSAVRTVDVTAGCDVIADFTDVEPPGTLEFEVSLAGSQSVPLDAHIVYLGDPPAVRTLGRYEAFTDADRTGYARLPFAPGVHRFEVTAGGGFLAAPSRVEVTVDAGRTTRVLVEVGPLEKPAERGWYCVDLHHHSNLADGLVSPEDLVVSQSAAGLDFVYVSDHDSVENHKSIAVLAAKRGLPFFPGIEVSPAWGHFNLYPLPLDRDPQLDPAATTPAEIFARARDLGALVQANHPSTDSNAYLTFHASGQLPVPFDDGFDFLEINGNDLFDEGDERTVAAAWAYWTRGVRKPLTGGSDTHDIRSGEGDSASGRVRTCAHLDARPTVEGLKRALAAGRSYVTLGPMLYPETLPGLTVKGPESVSIEVVAVNGVASVELVADGVSRARQTFADHPRRHTARFPFDPMPGAWYAFSVVDAAGNVAFTNPVWIDK